MAVQGAVELERAIGKNERMEGFKLESLKLESFAEDGKSQAKLERTDWSWKEPNEVGKNRAKLESLILELESFAEVGKFRRSWKVLVEVGKFEWTCKVVTDVGKFFISSKLGLGKLTNLA